MQATKPEVSTPELDFLRRGTLSALTGLKLHSWLREFPHRATTTSKETTRGGGPCAWPVLQRRGSEAWERAAIAKLTLPRK